MSDDEVLAFVAEFGVKDRAELLVVAEGHFAQERALRAISGLPRGRRAHGTAYVGSVRVSTTRAGGGLGMWLLCGRSFDAALICRGPLGVGLLREIERRTRGPVRISGVDGERAG